MIAATLCFALRRADDLVSLVVQRAVFLPPDEREALLKEVCARTTSSATVAIALLAGADRRLASELTEIITLKMAENVAKYAPTLDLTAEARP